MKKTLIALVIALGILGGGARVVEAQTSCTTITESNYIACCPQANPTACANFLNTRKAPAPSSGTGSWGSTTIRTDAQWRDYCNGISTVNNQSDFDNCCTDRHGVGYDGGRCYDWYMNGNTSTPGTVSSGTPNTNSPFTQQPLIAGNMAVSPQSSSPELASCSAIKFKSLLDILVWIKCVITSIIIPLIFTLAFLFFLWNVIRFMQASDSKNKEEAKGRMVWGIVALFVMLSVWGIITILGNTLGISPSVPLLQTETYLDPARQNKGK